MRATNVVTVTDTTPRGVGDRVWIAGLATDTTFNGAYEVTGSTPGTSWTYTSTGSNGSPTGTAQVLGDRCIDLELDVDGNSAAFTYLNAGTSHVMLGGNLSKSSLVIRDSRYNTFGRIFTGYNITDFEIPSGKTSIGINEFIQFDSYCDRVKIGTLWGENLNDDLLAWGVVNNSGTYQDTAPACGPGNMGTLVVDVLYANNLAVSPASIMKIYAYTGYDAGIVKIGTVTGLGAVIVGDTQSGAGGGTVTELSIDNLTNKPANNATQIILGGGGAFSNISRFNIGRFLDRPNTATSTGYAMIVGDPVTTLNVGSFVSTVDRSGAGPYGVVFSANVTSAKFGSMNTLGGDGSAALLANGANVVVDDLQVTNWTHNGANANSLLVYSQNGAYFKNVQITNFSVNVGKVISTNTSGKTHNWTLVNGRIDGSFAVASDSTSGTYNVQLVGINAPTLVNNLVQAYQTGTWRIVGQSIKAPAGQYVLTGQTLTMSINAPDFQVDMGVNGAGGAITTQLTPLAGDQLFNTNATGGGLYGRTAAGAWTKIF